MIPKRVMSGELENAGKRGPGGEEKDWTDCVAEGLRLFDITGDSNTAELPPQLTLGPGMAQYVTGAVGLWPRG